MRRSSYACKKNHFVGVDADDTAFHWAGIILETSELCGLTQAPPVNRLG